MASAASPMPLLLDHAQGWARLGALLLLASQLCGCSAVVVTQVREFDANEIVSLLLSKGVKARKLAAPEQSFDVEVPQAELGAALALLVDAGLPREKQDNLGDLFRREGLVSSATAEHIRYVHGLAKELERTLAALDGVASARVHVVIPQPALYAQERQPSSASILIRYRPSAEPSAFGPLVRSLVVRAVEGLQPEQVAIALAPVPALAALPDAKPGVLDGAFTPGAALPWILWLVTLPCVIWPSRAQALGHTLRRAVRGLFPRRAARARQDQAAEPVAASPEAEARHAA